MGSGGRCLFQECWRPHPKPCPVTPVGVPSEEDGTTVPPRNCHEARAGEDGEVLRQPKCHLPVTRVSPWPPRPPHDTSGSRASLIWSPKSSPDPLKPHRSFSASPTLLREARSPSTLGARSHESRRGGDGGKHPACPRDPVASGWRAAGLGWPHLSFLPGVASRGLR